MIYFEFQPNYNKLGEFVEFLGSCFSDIWAVMCRPFIDDYYFSWAGGRYEPSWSYLLPLIAFGVAVSVIALVKKLVETFVR